MYKEDIEEDEGKTLSTLETLSELKFKRFKPAAKLKS